MPWLGQDDLVKGVGILGKLVLEIGVLKAVHQVGRLHDEGLDAVVCCAIQGLLHVVDLHAVTLEDVVDDDLACEGAAHTPVGKGFLERRLDRADGEAAAVIEACAEGHDQQLLLADLICVAGIVQGRVARGVVFFLFFALRHGGRSGSSQQHNQHAGGQDQRHQFFHFVSPCFPIFAARIRVLHRFKTSQKGKPLSAGRRRTISCAPVSRAACAFSGKPPGPPPSFVTI